MTEPGFDRRRYAREYARRQRAAKLAARNAGATTCQSRLGKHGACGGILETITDGQGSTRTVCPLCERKRRGVCRECGLPVEGQRGKAIRCSFHKAQEALAATARYRQNNPAQYRRSARLSYQRDKAKRAARNEYKRLWRKANRDKVRAQKRRANLRGYGQRSQAERRARGAIARPATHTESRRCLTQNCTTTLCGRAKLCSVCKECNRLAAMEALRTITRHTRRAA